MKTFKQPCIFAVNHETFYDGPALFSYLRLVHKVKLAFMIKEEVVRDHFIWRFFIDKINYTIVKKEKPSEAVTETIKLLKRGSSVIIFPEGTTHKKETGLLLRGKTGVIRIALEEKVPIIPTGILYWGKRRPFKMAKKICFGDPFYVKPFNSYQGLREQTDRLMKKIATLSERKY
ncbi:MAG: lysophospholipid acyltransferase family protein [Patescibacteria group bacterium]|nr:lysophospholipid acyltransferase family protein [Patescibacteria group bacterium]